MGDSPLGRLLQAEDRAQRKIAHSKMEASDTIKKAHEEAKRKRDAGLRRFQERRESVLAGIGERSTTEADGIKNEGKEIASDLQKKLKSRIPEAARKIMDWYLLNGHRE